jgi:hypothetical protein
LSRQKLPLRIREIPLSRADPTNSDGGTAVQPLTSDEPNLTQRPQPQSARHCPETTEKTTTPHHDTHKDETHSNEFDKTIDMSLNDWQREWAQRFKNITDSTELGDTLTQFLGEARQKKMRDKHENNFYRNRL